MRRGAQLVSDMFAGKADGVEFLCKGIQIGLEISRAVAALDPDRGGDLTRELLALARQRGRDGA